MTNRRRCPAVAAAMLAALCTAGCTAHQAAAGGRGAAASAAMPAAMPAGTLPGRTAAPSPECRADDLGVKASGDQPGAGNDFAEIVAWDKAPVACRLAGTLTLAGLGPGGSVDTNAVQLTVTGTGELTAHGTTPGPGQVLLAGESAAWLLISAEYRDDPVTGAICTAHHVEPAAFRLTLPAGGTVTVADGGTSRSAAGGLTANGGLLTCRGELNTSPGLTHVAIGSAL